MTAEPWPIPFRILVDHVHDGDTVMGAITADAGLGIGVTLTGWSIRLYGIDSPELVTEQGQAARDALRRLVEPGDVLDVASYGFDKYGRRIDGIPFTHDGINLCEWMISAGFADVYPEA